MPEFLASYAQSAIEKADYRYRTLALEPAELAWFSDAKCINTWDGTYKVEVCGDAISEILRKYEIDALILSIAGTQGDPTNGPADLTGLGVFTRGTDRPLTQLLIRHTFVEIIVRQIAISDQHFVIPARAQSSRSAKRGRTKQ